MKYPKAGDLQKTMGNTLTANPRKNPAEIFQEDADAAVEKFKEFHRYDPRRLEELDGLAIPTRVRKLGAAKYVLYRSGKVDPATLRKPKKPVDYIHEHDAGVMAYATASASAWASRCAMAPRPAARRRFPTSRARPTASASW
jgi:hypothetical protein